VKNSRASFDSSLSFRA